MRRFIIILAILGLAFLLLSLAFVGSSFDILSLQNALTSDGKFDDVTLHAFSRLNSGLALAGLTLLILAALFYAADRGFLKIFQMRERNFLLALIGIQIILCAVFNLFYTYQRVEDTAWYFDQASHLAQGQAVVNAHSQPSAYWPIGYALFLSLFFRLFGSVQAVAQIVNIFIVSGIILLTYFIGVRLYNREVAKRATLIIAFLPSQIFYTFMPLADLLFILLALAVLYAALGKTSTLNTILLGLLMGMATLTRPTILLFLAVIAIYRYSRDRRWIPALRNLIIMALLCEAVLLPWQIRNYRAFGSFVLVSTNGGVHLWMGNNPVASGGYIGEWTFIPKETSIWMDDTMNEAQKDNYCSQQGWTYIRQHPLHALLLWPRKMIYLFMKDSHCLTYGFALNYKTISPLLLMALIAITEGYYYAVGLCFLISIYALLKRDKNWSRLWLIFGTILYFILIHLPFITEGRYHMPLLPLFVLVIAASSLASQKCRLSSGSG